MTVLRAPHEADRKGRTPLLLTGILVLSAVLQFVLLGRDGIGHPYYAATIQSMGTSWHNFFFASLDQAGFMAADKPPLGFWVQVLFVKILGFHGWVLSLPNAMATVLSVYLLFGMVRKHHGDAAGLMAAWFLTITPIAVATGRNATMDAMLVLLVILSASLALDAVESGAWKPLLLSALVAGLAFNLKMAQAVMAFPAMGLAYLLFAEGLDLRRKVLRLCAAGLIFVVVGFAWIAAVDLTPPAKRPFVGSTRNNSALELALGHNLVKRVWFMRQTPKGVKSALPPNMARKQGPSNLARLLSVQLGPQASWFFPLFLLGVVATFARGNPAPLRPSLVLWAVWGVTNALFFNLSRGVVHPHYLIMLGPPFAALSAIGLSWIRGSWDRPWAPAVLGSALTVTAALQFHFVWRTGQGTGWLLVPIGLAALLAVHSIGAGKSMGSVPRRRILVAALGLLLAAPTSWSFMPMIYGGHKQLPYAGPKLDRDFFASRSRFGERLEGERKKLAEFLMKEDRGERFIAGVTDAQGIGAPLILETKRAVLVLGGFLGLDEPLDLEGFKALVNAGHLRYFVTPFGAKKGWGRDGKADPGEVNQAILDWVTANGKEVKVEGTGMGMHVFRLPSKDEMEDRR